MHFEVLGDNSNIQPIAIGSSIRDIARLRRQYGPGRWRKLKGIARVQRSGGKIREAEIHRYEAHGIGRKKFKIKRFVD